MRPSEIFRGDLFADQVAVITGGGTGIGVAIARELGRLGATVVIASRKEANIRPAAEGLTAELGREVIGEICDIRDRGAVTSLVERVLGRVGRIDLLVNNGGGQFFAPAEAITPKGWDAVVATNLTGTWNMTRAVADGWMLAHGGTVLSITMLTKRTFPGMAHSVAARAGIEAMTRTLAVEWASKGIRLNCVAPGFVASSGLRRYPAGLDLIAQMKSLVPMKRLARCEEVAWTVAWLASPAGAYVTGQVITLDGGKELWGDWWPIADPPDMEPVVIPKEPWEE
ncbi:MAG TPA: SDR family oxidoreductase [Deltaproteobacteria bacterium]|nr:SDR family oxidoreductase [Deltaproteobacteria bacterium]